MPGQDKTVPLDDVLRERPVDEDRVAEMRDSILEESRGNAATEGDDDR